MPGRRTTQTPQQQPTPIGGAYDAFLVARQAAGVTPATLAYYRGKLHPFITWCTDVRSLATVDAITATHVRAYLVHHSRVTHILDMRDA